MEITTLVVLAHKDQMALVMVTLDLSQVMEVLELVDLAV